MLMGLNGLIEGFTPPLPQRQGGQNANGLFGTKKNDSVKKSFNNDNPNDNPVSESSSSSDIF